tara:strand:+ start:42 stop:551 length:510 start_codon:yes stop_codon:yes gene_type:complete
MSRRGSSTEQLQENRKGNLFGNFLNNIKGAYDTSGLSFEQFLPAPFRINYDITRGKVPYEKELTTVFSFLNKDNKDEKDKKEDERDYLDENKQLLGEIANLSEKARDRAALRTGISNLALSPLIGGQAAMEAAKNVADLTALNMGAMAAQNRVLETNPTKQKIAGRYFR